LGIQNADRQAVLAELGFVETQEVVGERLPEYACAEISDGWLIIYAHASDWASRERAASLSAGGVAVGCMMTTVVMYSEAFEYRDGELQWSVLHDLEDNKELDLHGVPPAEFGRLSDEAFRLEKEEGDVDFVFDVPITLAGAVTGFDVNRHSFSEGPVFMVLEATRTPRKEGPLVRWLGNLFGRQD
jgi:hypothetical protein